MAYQGFTPYQAPLQPDSFHDSDDIAAAWRIFATQIKAVYKTLWDTLTDLAAALNKDYLAYLKTTATEKVARFSLTSNIATQLDASSLVSYHGRLNLTGTKNLFREFNLVLYHLEDHFGVPSATLAGVMAGNLLTELGLQEIVAQEIVTNLGGSSVITEIPGPSLAGQYKPSHFPKKANGNGNGNKYQMAFRRRY